MERIEMSKRVVLPKDYLEGTRIGKLRGMLVYLEGDVGDYVISVRVYRDGALSSGKYQVIADLSLSTEYCAGAYHVDLMRVDYRFQGHGIAPLLYRFLLQKLGIVIQAGTSQSAGGRKLWAQLAKTKGIQVFTVGRRSKQAALLESEEDQDELTHESIKLYDGSRTVYTFAAAV